MKKVRDFQVVDLGIDNPLFFQGFGTALTPYDEAAVGASDTPAEAWDAALDQLASMGYDVDGIHDADFEGPRAQNISASDKLEHEADCAYLDDGECDCGAFDGDGLYYYVGIRVRGGTARVYA